MPPDSVTMVHNCLYSDSEFSPTAVPSRFPSGMTAFVLITAGISRTGI